MDGTVSEMVAPGTAAPGGSSGCQGGFSQNGLDPIRSSLKLGIPGKCEHGHWEEGVFPIQAMRHSGADRYKYKRHVSCRQLGELVRGKDIVPLDDEKEMWIAPERTFKDDNLIAVKPKRPTKYVYDPNDKSGELRPANKTITKTFPYQPVSEIRRSTPYVPYPHNETRRPGGAQPPLLYPPRVTQVNAMYKHPSTTYIAPTPGGGAVPTSSMYDSELRSESRDAGGPGAVTPPLSTGGGQTEALLRHQTAPETTDPLVASLQASIANPPGGVAYRRGSIQAANARRRSSVGSMMSQWSGEGGRWGGPMGPRGSVTYLAGHDLGASKAFGMSDFRKERFHELGQNWKAQPLEEAGFIADGKIGPFSMYHEGDAVDEDDFDPSVMGVFSVGAHTTQIKTLMDRFDKGERFFPMHVAIPSKEIPAPTHGVSALEVDPLPRETKQNGVYRVVPRGKTTSYLPPEQNDLTHPHIVLNAPRPKTAPKLFSADAGGHSDQASGTAGAVPAYATRPRPVEESNSPIGTQYLPGGVHPAAMAAWKTEMGQPIGTRPPAFGEYEEPAVAAAACATSSASRAAVPPRLRASRGRKPWEPPTPRELLRKQIHQEFDLSDNPTTAQVEEQPTQAERGGGQSRGGVGRRGAYQREGWFSKDGRGPQTWKIVKHYPREAAEPSPSSNLLRS
uniref:Uncharacterized protein n=1 Tax=Chromera velia CCMP2878 TaxID=1169474 RepID=A0A0G4HVU3_9ALVE|eukprot:Cvel_8874.t1-p1 / transcript=Cvel_8874.t1 / gene=Cvel_8874 / organism=Chromera_velia_CCMP2878 / gene_product=hypothetical protein / transcript_product=hypothetical protein / location=Cvel_scaffold499:30377-32401(-) / protein_length=675 / sequence_SO=supercontig / SO=protein_coding / is_pseudo=false